MIAQMSGKIVTFVCIFRENIDKTRKRKRKPQKQVQNQPHPSPHPYMGRELACVGWGYVSPLMG
jgi:hypothetical protein